MGYHDKLVGPAIRFNNYLDKFPKVYNAIFIGIVSCISGMMFGFDIASMSCFIGTDQYMDFFNSPDSDLQGIITSSMALGSFFGCFASGVVSEPFGRRAALYACSFFWMVGAAIQSSSQNVAQLICGRLISGFGIGFGSSVAPVYGSELAPRKIRGLIGCLFQFSVTVGIMVMFYICYGCSQIKGTASFRLAWAIQIIPGLLLFFGLFFLPESPRWWAKQGNWEACELIVANIHARGNKEDPDVLVEISEIKEQIMLDENINRFRYIDLFKKKYINRTITAVFAQIWQQLTGMNTLMYYIVYVFDMAGYSGNTNLIASSIQYVLNVVMTLPAFYLVDKFGRRPVLLVGAVFMFIFQCCIGGLLATYSIPHVFEGNPTVRIQIPKENVAAARGVIACCYLFVCSFAPTWGVAIWVYCAEVWGDSASRQRGAAVSTAADWALNFAIGMFTPSAFKNITWKTYFVFAAFCGCMFIHVFFFFPETRGKRLEEIGQIWDEHVPAWKTASWQPRIPLFSDIEVGQKHIIEDRETSGSHSDVTEGKGNTFITENPV